jgi:hypothetical protein
LAKDHSQEVNVFSEPEKLKICNQGVLVTCPVQVHESYQLLQTGTWWTSWCHDPNDVSPGGFAGITEAATTTVTFDGDLLWLDL